MSPLSPELDEQRRRLALEQRDRLGRAEGIKKIRILGLLMCEIASPSKSATVVFPWAKK